MTATKKFGTSEIEEIQRHLKQQKPTNLFDERPQTSAIVAKEEDPWNQKVPPPLSQKTQAELSGMVKNQISGIFGRILELNITETWGDLFYVGLTSLEILGANLLPLSLPLSSFKA